MATLTDSNIPLRIIDPVSPDRVHAWTAVQRLRRQGESLLLAPQSVAEIWSVMTRPATSRGGMGLTLQEASQTLRVIERFFSVIPDPPGLYARWRNLIFDAQVMGVQVHDARLAAFAAEAGAGRLLTFNTKDFARYASHLPGVMFQHPNQF